MDLLQTPNTAPVLEFRCLFSQDLRRKQKRWQDGRLKFHTFNKRVMVYDEKANFVGDMHWRGEGDFDESEELELERGGALVQVGECIGKKDQDLTELLGKRVKERGEKLAARGIGSSPTHPTGLANTSQLPKIPAGVAHLRPKTLNALLGTPTGHYGRAAVSTATPYERRQGLNNARQEEYSHDRPAKRKKQNDLPSSKSCYAQNIMGATLNLSKPPSTATSHSRTSIRQSPVESVDLARHDDSSNKQPSETRRAGEKNDEKFARATANGLVQIRKPDRSPPVRSDYVRNVTGASLALSGGKDLLSAQVNETIRQGAGGPDKAVIPVQNQSSENEDDFVEIDTPEKMPIMTAPKPTRIPPKKSALPKRASIHSAFSSPPPRLDLRTPATTSTFIHPVSGSRHSSAPTDSSDQSHSVLRIKARAPRKMMMLMERPHAKVSTSRKSSDIDMTEPNKRGNLTSTPHEVVLSQATKHLKAFQKRQEDRLQSRLNRIRSNANEELLSSPSDTSIDYQAIDALLTHKSNMPTGVYPAVPVSIAPEVLRRQTVSRIFCKSNLSVAVVNMPNIALNSSNATVAHGSQCLNSPKIPGKGIVAYSASDVGATDPEAPERQESSVTIVKEGSNPIISQPSLTTNSTAIVKGDLVEHVPDPNEMSSEAVLGDREHMAWSGFEREYPVRHSTTTNKSSISNTTIKNPKPTVNLIDGRINSDSINELSATSELKSSSASIRPRSLAFPSYINNCVFPATDNFRRMIQPQVSLPQSVHSVKTLLEQRAERKSIIAPKAETGSGELVSNVLPKATSCTIKSSNGGVKTTSIIDLAVANGLDDGFEASNQNPIARDNTSLDTSQASRNVRDLTTRGKPAVQKTTNNVLVPMAIAIPAMPPPPNFSHQPRRDLAENSDAANRSARELEDKFTAGGPWSRESFDLFSWKPPSDRGTMIMSTAA